MLKQKLGEFGEELVWAKKPKKMPVVFTKEEAKAVLSHLSGTYWIMAMLLYGSGLGLMECIRLRIQDVDFGYNQIIVRDGKGEKDRVTMLAEKVKVPLQDHLVKVKKLHEADLKAGYGSVYLPYALERKYPNASRQWGWQFTPCDRNNNKHKQKSWKNFITHMCYNLKKIITFMSGLPQIFQNA